MGAASAHTQAAPENHTEGSRYRWLDGAASGAEVCTRGIEGGGITARYMGASATLYGRGEPVAVSMQASGGTRGGAAYLGKDILGSVRSVSNETGALESRYEYDAFGTPYTGDFSSGMNLGYTGKPYDSATGLYNYGYRDYQPEVARFTTVDPIRDGNNWFAYVNNDPVNYVDPWGLSPSDKSASIAQLAPEHAPVSPANAQPTPEQNNLIEVHAIRDGTVFRAGWQDQNNPNAGMGWRISIDTKDGHYDQYGHLDPGSTLEPGTTVKTNDVIGKMADPTNGHSTGPHVHVERRSNYGTHVNPGNTSPFSVPSTA
jgi:RHS repeat-associated protein